MSQTVKCLRLSNAQWTRSALPSRRAVVLKAHQMKDVAGKLKERQEKFGMTEDQSLEVVRDVLDIVQDILISGDDVVLRGEKEGVLSYIVFVGFGKFSRKNIGKREYRNPRTGELIVKDGLVRVSFQPSTSLKKVLNEKMDTSEKK